MKLCFATNNVHKLTEVRLLLNDLLPIVSLQDIGCLEELLEEGKTLEENSFQKAEYVVKKYGIACFADDTGLEVDVLNKEPGVYSARYAGKQKNNQDNIRLLLSNLAGKSNRRARFRTVITLIMHGKNYSFEGTMGGNIGMCKRGTSGFGYDPIFIPDGHSISIAEMTVERKNTISHRGEAMGKLSHFLKQNV